MHVYVYMCVCRCACAHVCMREYVINACRKKSRAVQFHTQLQTHQFLNNCGESFLLFSECGKFVKNACILTGEESALERAMITHANCNTPQYTLQHTATHTKSALERAVHTRAPCNTLCNTHCNTHCNIQCNPHCNTRCNTHCRTRCNTHCNTHYNTHCNTHCNTHFITHCITHCIFQELCKKSLPLSGRVCVYIHIHV